MRRAYQFSCSCFMCVLIYKSFLYIKFLSKDIPLVFNITMSCPVHLMEMDYSTKVGNLPRPWHNTRNSFKHYLVVLAPFSLLC